MEGERKTIYRALLVVDKAAIVPMVYWSFGRSGFLLDFGDIRNPVQLIRPELWVELPFLSLKSMMHSSILMQCERRLKASVPPANAQ